MIAARSPQTYRLRSTRGLATLRDLWRLITWLADRTGQEVSAEGVTRMHQTSTGVLLEWSDSGPIGPAGAEGLRGPIGPTGGPGTPASGPAPVGPPGPAGPTGGKGATGNPGADGLQGDQGDDSIVVGDPGDPGAPGPAGPRGPDGPTGSPNPGADGDVGPTGAPGPAGINTFGADGPTGPAWPFDPTYQTFPQGDGAPGPTGPTGPDGDPTKTALLPTTRGIVALHALEGEEALFKDVITLPIPAHGIASADVCHIFRECCEPGSLFVQFAHLPASRALIGTSIRASAGRLCVDVRLHPAPRREVLATLTICGIRKGFATAKLMPCTRAQMQANNQFYTTAHVPSS